MPSLPSGMDKLLKEHFDRFMEKGMLPPELARDKRLHGCTLFNDREKLAIWRNNFKGLRYEHDDIRLRGAIDNLLVTGTQLIILDYKTRGYPLKDDSHLYYQDQLDLYAFLLKQNGYTVAPYAYLLFYHPVQVTETGEVVFETDMVQMDVSPDHARELLANAMTVLAGDIPDAAEECQFCQWAKDAT
ncbi:MAG: PD-(D/E)XK nuclease family protein [Candidatus Aenigmarchaeota archaeon]|nr:PD-(D/E)XK nuclease family protein [Candidatus Aenigmarchaeota archaeon]